MSCQNHKLSSEFKYILLTRWITGYKNTNSAALINQNVIIAKAAWSGWCNNDHWAWTWLSISTIILNIVPHFLHSPHYRLLKQAIRYTSLHTITHYNDEMSDSASYFPFLDNCKMILGKSPVTELVLRALKGWKSLVFNLSSHTSCPWGRTILS